jgi:uncharacterized protein (TIGR03083 family)
METAQHIAALVRDGNLLAMAAERAGPDAPVPSCPPWLMRDLIRHLGYVHRWAAGYVRGQPLPGDPSEDEVLRSGPPDAELIGWFRAGHAALVSTLRVADPALQCWTPVPGPSGRAAWARRQAHETAIHRVDAELALGPVTPFPADFAADGIDELIMGFFGRDREGLDSGQRAAPPVVLQVLAADEGATAAAWLVELSADGRRAARVHRGPGPSACTLAGPASGLYQLLWNRCDHGSAGVTVSGDARVAQSWRDAMRVRWA